MAVYKIAILLFTDCFLKIHASYHWIVTENGKIQSQIENSAFPLRRPDDLMALLEQEQRIAAVSELYQKLMTYKRSIDNQWSRIEGESDLEKRLYATDEDCIKGVLPLVQHDLNVEFVEYGFGSRPKMKGNKIFIEPDCSEFSNLDFSMMTFPHLETLNKRENVNLTVNSVPLERKPFNFDVHGTLKKNQSDWTAYNMGALFWRLKGNGTKALECARRAVYFSPRSERYIALLNLGTLLQEVQSLGDAAIVLHSAVDHDPVQHISHFALGNVYAALGDYTRSLACYENVLSLNPGHVRALRLKHALLCHKKIEAGLLEIHSALQSILQDLQKYHEMQEKWLFLQNQISWERDNRHKDLFSLSHPVSLNLRMLLQNVEDQAKSLNEEMNKRVSRKNNYIQIHSKVERNQFKTESVFDCSVEKCPVYVNQDRNNEVIIEKTRKIKKIDNFEDEDELVLLDNSESLLKNRMNSLIAFIKTLNYDSELNLNDFKNKINQQINFLKELNSDAHFSIDQSLFLNNFDACVNDHNDVKKLNECFMRIFDRYSVDVSNRIKRLKEKIKLINQVSVKTLFNEKGEKISFPDESTLENYMEANPELVFENFKESESCQRFRDTTEL